MKNSVRTQLAYVYYSNEPGRQSAAKLLSQDEARRIAANIAKLRELFPENLIRADTRGKRLSAITASA